LHTDTNTKPILPHSNGNLNHISVSANGHNGSSDTSLLLDKMKVVEEAANSIDDTELVHPLDVKRKSVQLGWIDHYAALMTKMTNAPVEFHQLGALILVASVIQRRACLRMAFGEIFTNLYGAIIARSSVFHKSSSMAKVRTTIQRAMLDKLLFSELMTSEGLLGQMQSKPCGVILRDEIGTLFSSHNTKYLANLKPDLTALFDCYPYSRRLSQQEIKVDTPYLNILGATTPTRFFEGVAMTDWQDGFLARWLFVLPDSEPDFDSVTGMYTQKHDEELTRMTHALMEIDKQRDTDFSLLGDSFEIWDKWQRQATKDAYYFGDDVSSAIVSRYATYALKFSMILSAVNGSWGEVTPCVMQTSIDLADNYKSYAFRLLSEKANFGISGSKLQKVFGCIKARTKEKGVPTKEILQYCNMNRSEAEPYLNKLKEIGAVIEEKAGNGYRYIVTTQDLPIKAWK